MSGFSALFVQLLVILVAASAVGFLFGRWTARRPTSAVPAHSAGHAAHRRLVPDSAAGITGGARAVPSAETPDPPEPRESDAGDTADSGGIGDTGGGSVGMDGHDPAGGLIAAEPTEEEPTEDNPVFDAVLALQQGVAEAGPAEPPLTPDADESPATPDADESPASEPPDSGGIDALLREKEEEIGRLETGAITALERTISTFQDRVGRLEAELRDSRSRSRELSIRADEEGVRVQRLQTALAERDAHLAALRDDLEPRS